MLNQVEFHPLLDNVDLLAFCRQQGILLQAYSPLAQVWSLMLISGINLTSSCLQALPALFNCEELVSMSSRLKKSVAQLLLRWVCLYQSA